MLILAVSESRWRYAIFSRFRSYSLTYVVLADGNTGTYCSHFRAAEYYIEALQEKNGCSMLSYTCSGGLAQFEAGKCEIDDEYWNVISLEETEGFPGRGVQFVDTHRKSPYCKSMESSSEISSKDQ